MRKSIVYISTFFLLFATFLLTTNIAQSSALAGLSGGASASKSTDPGHAFNIEECRSIRPAQLSVKIDTPTDIVPIQVEDKYYVKAPPKEPTLSVNPGAACVGQEITVTGGGMPQGAVSVIMVLMGASGWNDAPLGSTVADSRGNWSLTTTVPNESTNHHGSQDTAVSMLWSAQYKDTWTIKATGSDGITKTQGQLTVLNCQS